MDFLLENLIHKHSSELLLPRFMADSERSVSLRILANVIKRDCHMLTLCRLFQRTSQALIVRLERGTMHDRLLVQFEKLATVNRLKRMMNLVKVKVDHLNSLLVFELRVDQINLENTQEALDTCNRNVEMPFNHLVERELLIIAEDCRYDVDDLF